jgi:photosystem II stability/assembly factor-like uncharacterized protein
MMIVASSLRPARAARVLVSILLCACALASWAGLNEWTTAGPWGGVVRDVADDPSAPGTLLATGYTGVFRSTDGGLHWAAVGAGLPSAYFQCVVTSPGPPAAIYVGGQGVYKSTDGGLTWSSASSGLPGGVINYLAASPADGQTLFACPANGGLYVTTDGGNTWTATGAGLGTMAVRLPIFVPGSPSIMYLGAGPGGVYKSIDGGANWSAAGASMASVPVFTLVFDPATSQKIYAGTDSGHGSLWKSTDGGSTWQASASGLTSGYVNRITFGAGKLWAATDRGLYSSSDGAATWVLTSTGLPEGWDNVVKGVSYDSHTVLACPYGVGLMKSIDGGATWTEANTGITAWEMFGVVATASGPSKLYCIGDPGLPFTSADDGSSWTRVSEGLLASNRGIRLAPDPQAPETLFLSTDGNGIFKTTDGGATWSKAGNPSPDYGYGLTVDPTNSQIVYAGGSRKLMKSIDGGGTWTDITGGITGSWFQDIVVDPTSHQTLYTTCTGGGVFKSPDGGATWTKISGSLPDQSTNVLLLDPWTHTTLYAWTGSHGLYKTTDGGTTWTPLAGSPQNSSWGTDLAADPGTPGTLYIAYRSSDVYKSSDGGATWQALGAPGLASKYFYGMTVDRNIKDRLHVAIYGVGVWSLDQCTQMTCTAVVPTHAVTGMPNAFQSAPSCGAPYASYDWNFGDGSAHSSEQNPSHTFASAGARTWTLTVRVGPQTCTKTGSIAVVDPPAVTSLKKVAPPFKFVVAGSNLQSGIRVFIDGAEWTGVAWKKTTKVQITGGASLKAAVPKGVAKTFRFLNPDGGEANTTWSW